MAYIDDLLQTNQIPPVNASQLQGYSVPDYPARLTPYSQPNGYIGRTLQQVDAKRQENEAQNVLLPLIQNIRERMQPTTYDVSQSALRSATPDYYKATTPQEMAKERVENELAPYTTMLGLQAKLRQAQQNPAGATGELIDRLIRDNPGMTYTQALYAVQGSGMKRGLALDQNGNVIAQTGAPQALGLLKAGETLPTEEGKKVLSRQYDPETEGMKAEKAASARAGVELSTAGAIESERERGKKQPIIEMGQKKLSPIVDQLSGLYDQLEQKKATVSTQNKPGENVSAALRQSWLGQQTGKLFGTPEQSLRNQVSMARPALINAIREVTGMSARAMDSNTELQFYLQMATDPTVDVQANRSALKMIQEQYLDPSRWTKTPPSLPNEGGFNIDAYLKEKGLQ